MYGRMYGQMSSLTAVKWENETQYLNGLEFQSAYKNITKQTEITIYQIIPKKLIQIYFNLIFFSRVFSGFSGFLLPSKIMPVQGLMTS